MFKKIPGNSEFLINLRREIINSYGVLTTLKGKTQE